MVYKRRVCVLGGTYSGEKNIIGKKLITKNPDCEFTIIGILHKKMPLFTTLPKDMVENLLKENNVETGRKYQALQTNDAIYIPFTTWQDFVKEKDLSVVHSGGLSLESETLDKSLFSSSSFPVRSFIWMKIDTLFEGKDGGDIIKDKKDMKVFGDFFYCPIPKRLKESLDSIRKTLRKKYGNDKFFHFIYYGSLNEELNDQIEASNKLIGIISLFSLLLSGIILTSMMLMSVYNRVQEIGVRRAFGARKKDIFFQFLSEGVINYSIGIVVGLVIGILASYLLITKIMYWEFSIPVFGIIISSIFVFVVGIISSLYPAMKAANIPLP